MRERPAVAIEVFVGLVIVVLLDPHHDPVPDKGPDPAGMCVIGRTDPREGGVVPILIVVDSLPGPVRVVAEGVAHLDDRLQCCQRQGLVGHCDRRHRPGRNFQELSP